MGNESSTSVEPMDVDAKDEEDVFFSGKLKPKARRPTKKRPKQIKISITSKLGSPSRKSSAALEEEKEEETTGSSFDPYAFARNLDDDTPAQRERELEDTLSFFEETHEDQDPEFKEIQAKIEEEERKRQLEEVDKSDEAGRREIEAVVNRLFKEKQAAAETNVENYRARLARDEKLNVQRLEQLTRRKSQEKEREIQNGIELLQRRHQEQVRRATPNELNRLTKTHYLR